MNSVFYLGAMNFMYLGWTCCCCYYYQLTRLQLSDFLGQVYVVKSCQWIFEKKGFFITMLNTERYYPYGRQFNDQNVPAYILVLNNLTIFYGFLYIVSYAIIFNDDYSTYQIYLVYITELSNTFKRSWINLPISFLKLLVRYEIYQCCDKPW